MISKIKLIIFLSTIFIANAFGSDIEIRKAILFDKTDTVRSYLNNGLEVNKVIDRYTLLGIAVNNNALCVAELLILRGAECNKKLGSPTSPLFWSIASGHILMTYLLLSRGGAKPNFIDLYSALQIRNNSFIKLLIEFNADIHQKHPDTNRTLEEVAESKGFQDKLEILKNAEKIKKEGKLKQKLEKELKKILKEKCK